MIRIHYPDGYFEKRPRDLSVGKAEFNEADHPRDSDGKFTDGNGGATATTEPELPEATQRIQEIYQKHGVAVSISEKGNEHLHLAHSVDRSLDIVREFGVPKDQLPSYITATAKIPQDMRDAGAMAAYDPRSGDVLINPDSPFWQNPRAQAVAMGPGLSGFLSSDSPFHPVVHEVGHHMHKLNLGENWNRPPAPHPRFDEIASKVSRYAATHRDEFVAETFAAMATGRKLDQDVMDMYDYYGGWRKK